MSYTRTTWIARVGTALNRFLKTNEDSPSGTVELTNDPTGVTTAGTPFTVANMNKIEDGIYDSHYPTFTEASTLENVTSGEVQETLWGKVMKAISYVIGTAKPHIENTSNPHSVSKEQVTGLKVTDSPTFAKLTLTTSTYGSQSIASEGTWVVPAGIYVFVPTVGILVQIWTGSAWVGSGDSSISIHGAVISDGSNIRLRNREGSTKTVDYRKFS